MSEEKNTYTVKSGYEFTLRKINPTILQAFQLEGRPRKPDIPMVASEVWGMDEPQLEPNPDHPGYKQAIDEFERKQEEYQSDQLINIMKYCFVFGVVDEPEPEWARAHARFLPDKDKRKYSWVFSKLENIEEGGELLNIIIGQTMPTDEAVAEAEERFLPDGDNGGGDNPSQSVQDEA